jgi:cyclase
MVEKRIHIQQIAKDVYSQAEMRGANTTFVVTSEGIVLIDLPPDIENGKRWLEEVKKHGEIRFVINTEAHHDHWVTNSLFGHNIIAHEACRELMLIMDHKFIRERTALLYVDPFPYPDDFEIRLPNITFSKNMTLRLGQITFQLIHTPGHMEGQIAVYIPERKVLCTGDTIINRMRAPYHDAITDDRWLDSMRTLDKLDVEHIVPGHGDLIQGKDFIKTQTEVYKGFLKAVKEGKTKGVKISEEINREFDPFYDVLPRGQKPGGITLAPSAESKNTGYHGKPTGKG